jgi:hypothetical protein
MPHALTEREKEYLAFLREYIHEHETTPQLKDVAGHFGVKLPSAHKVLEALQSKGYLRFWRSKAAGYNLRLAERGGGVEKAIQIHHPGADSTNTAKCCSSPASWGTFRWCCMGVDENRVFAVQATADIPQETYPGGGLLDL